MAWVHVCHVASGREGALDRWQQVRTTLDTIGSVRPSRGRESQLKRTYFIRGCILVLALDTQEQRGRLPAT
eukprot:34675-Pelagomonas_calceolata.AAC.3